MYSLRHAASFPRESCVMSAPSMISVPSLGRSMPAMRLRSVVFPLPLGPMRARNSPASTSRLSRSSGRMTFSPRRYSRLRLRHSMSAMEISFADDADALTFLEPLRIGDDAVTGLKSAGDGDPAVLARLAELDHAEFGGVFAWIDNPDHRHSAAAVDERFGREDGLAACGRRCRRTAG